MVAVIVVLVSLFLGFCGVADAASQPGQAFKASGHSKPLWVLIELVGMATIVGGVVTWAIYSYGGTRRDVVRAGGYNRANEIWARKVTRSAIREQQAQNLWAQSNAPQTQPQRQPQVCGSCTNGQVPCGTCNAGWVTPPDGSQPQQHMACGGSGWVRCAACNGSGVR